MNPLGVLRARDIMRPVSGTPDHAIPADILIRDGMDRLIDSERPIGVEEDGRIIGQIAKDDLLRTLSGPLGET